MKKTILRVVALALIAVMTCTLLASCGGPASDPDKAEKALKDADYVVIHTPGKVLGIGIDGCTDIVTATKGDNSISIWYFEDTKSAKNAWEDIDELKKEISKDKEDSDIVCKKSGKMIYIGTKQAVKDAK